MKREKQRETDKNRQKKRETQRYREEERTRQIRERAWERIQVGMGEIEKNKEHQVEKDKKNDEVPEREGKTAKERNGAQERSWMGKNPSEVITKVSEPQDNF